MRVAQPACGNGLSDSAWVCLALFPTKVAYRTGSQMSMAIMPFNILGLPISPNASPNLCVILWVFKSYPESEALFGACLCRAQNTSETPSYLVTFPRAWLRAMTSEFPLASAAHALELTGGLRSWQSPWVAMSSAQETACRRTAGPRLEVVCSRFSHRQGKLCGEWTLTHIFHIFTYFFFNVPSGDSSLPSQRVTRIEMECSHHTDSWGTSFGDR